MASIWRRPGSVPPPTATASAQTSPEAVVEGVVEAASRWDVDSLIDLLDPESMAAVHDYRNALVSLASDDSGVLPGIQVDRIEARVVERSGNRAQVAVEQATGQLYWYDDYLGPQQVSFDAGGACATVSASDGRAGSGCLDSPEVLDWFAYADLVGYDARGSRNMFLRWIASTVEEPTVEVVEREGRWYLSPVGTAMGLLSGPADELDVQTLAFVSGLELVMIEPSGRLELGVPAPVAFDDGELVKVFEIDVPGRTQGSPYACLSIGGETVGSLVVQQVGQRRPRSPRRPQLAGGPRPRPRQRLPVPASGATLR